MAESEQAEVERLRGELMAARTTIAELQDRLHEMERRVAAEHAVAAVAVQQIRDLRKSRSWQLTAPLRNVMRKARD